MFLQESILFSESGRFAMSDASNSNAGGVHAVYFPSWKVYKGVTPAQVVECGVNTVFYAFIM